MTGAASIWARMLPVLTILFAVAIFAIDTFTTLDIAIAVLYVVVVLVAANLFHRRGVLVVSAGCMVLTVASFLLSHGFTINTALVRCLVSLSAIAITTLLALANQSTMTMLKEQAELLDLTHDMVLVRDMADVMTYWNRGAEQLYGWPKDEALGKSSHELLKTEFSVPVEQINTELLRTGRWEGDLTHHKRDGSRVLVSSRWALLRGEAGQPISVMETNTDVTERSRAQEALQEAQTQLAHVTRVTTLGELAASIAHEVNQPLAAIVTNGEAGLRWLDREVPDVEEARTSMRGMIESAKRAGQVIARLRALARKTGTAAAPLDVGEVINEVVLLIRRELARRRVRLRLELTPSPLVVSGDRVQLQQVLMNLAINGIQAMAQVQDRPRELVIRSRGDGEGVVVAVEDAGTGMSPDDVYRVFQPFYTTKAEGMGMGLSISRSIIEAHDGKIWVTPNAGHGVTFEFSLPAAPGNG